MPRSTRQLESFAPAVLAEFIRANVPMLTGARTDKVFAELVRTEARQRLERINDEIKQLIAKGESLHGKEYLAVQNQLTALWAELPEAMEIAFPTRLTKANSPEKTNGQNND